MVAVASLPLTSFLASIERSTTSDVDLLASLAYIGQISVSHSLSLSPKTHYRLSIRPASPMSVKSPHHAVAAAMFAIVSGSSASAAS